MDLFTLALRRLATPHGFTDEWDIEEALYFVCLGDLQYGHCTACFGRGQFCHQCDHISLPRPK